MPRLRASCPLPRSQVVDLYFMEHRAKLIDLAAFLDRVDRAAPGGMPAEDFRLAALRRAIAVLLDGRPERVRRILESLSDPTAEPLASAAGLKGASGAWKGEGEGQGRKGSRARQTGGAATGKRLGRRPLAPGPAKRRKAVRP